MKPRYKMRWLVKRNKVTAEQIKQYATEHNLRMMEAKKILVNEIQPVLQYWDDGGSLAVMGGGEWRDVPYIVEEHE